MSRHRKRIKHFHEPRDLHELTFSCYRRLRLLTNDVWREKLARTIDDAMSAWNFRLVAFVFMPEHVHLLIAPHDPQAQIGKLLAAVKQPYSSEIHRILRANRASLLTRLTVRERPGKLVFRYWQEGPGYDRNLQSRKAVYASIDYIHNNPVKRGLCKQAIDWRWSSARFYLLPDAPLDPSLPVIHGLQPEYLLALDARVQL